MRTRRADYSTDGLGTPRRAITRRTQALKNESCITKRKLAFKQKDSVMESRPLKRSRVEAVNITGENHFEELPDDLIIAILRCLSSSAGSPADFANAMLTCRRFYSVAMHPLVLMVAGRGTLAVKASLWSDGAHRFLTRCAEVGNLEACYTLGMIKFYCLENKTGGATLMTKAAMASHAPALHSLAVIQFNGSGGTKRDKDLKAGVALCVRAAALGHVDAMRELGHCLQDGYGVQRNVSEGRRLLLEANAREAAAAGINPPLACLQNAIRLTMTSPDHYQRRMTCDFSHDKEKPLLESQDSRDEITTQQQQQQQQQDQQNHNHNHSNQQQPHSVLSFLQRTCCSLLSDFGCNVPPAEPHIANRFLAEWFGMSPPHSGLRLCSNEICGRPETRRHEFRRCSACSSVNYCSRACQALDWKTTHRYVCMPPDEWDDLHEDEDF